MKLGTSQRAWLIMRLMKNQKKRREAMEQLQEKPDERVSGNSK